MKNKKIYSNKRKGQQRFVDASFAKLLDETRRTRIVIEKDSPNHMVADWRITLAFTRHPLTKKIIEDIVNADLN